MTGLQKTLKAADWQNYPLFDSLFFHHIFWTHSSENPLRPTRCFRTLFFAGGFNSAGFIRRGVLVGVVDGDDFINGSLFIEGFVIIKLKEKHDHFKKAFRVAVKLHDIEYVFDDLPFLFNNFHLIYFTIICSKIKNYKTFIPLLKSNTFHRLSKIIFFDVLLPLLFFFPSGLARTCSHIIYGASVVFFPWMQWYPFHLFQLLPLFLPIF